MRLITWLIHCSISIQRLLILRQVSQISFYILSISIYVDENKWDLIFDFTENQEGALNFSVMEPSDWRMKNVPVEGMSEEPVVAFPYPERYGGTIADDAKFGEENPRGGMMAFGFDMSQQDAEKAAALAPSSSTSMQ